MSECRAFFLRTVFFFSFQNYVDMWLKVKAECSSWPPGCETEAQKNAYIEQFERVEGIKLDRTAICKNDSLRLVAKLFLNRYVNGYIF